MLSISLQFSGGSEKLLDDRREVDIKLPIDADRPCTVEILLEWINKNLLKDCDRPEMLISKGTVRPGILVLINDIDWELLGGLETILSDDDTVSFISTLHGG